VNVAVAVPPFPIARFSVEQYHRMIESGAFTEHDQLELIEGWVVQKMAKGPAHEFSLGRTEEALRALLPPGWYVRNQSPLTLTRSEPEPDLVVARGERAAHRFRHPGASEVALVVEISDTTLATDRLKAQTYAGEGIIEYWLVNLGLRCVEVHKSPHEGRYREPATFLARDEIALVLDGEACGAIPVARLLP
jgi:Uma2 family endonuclease